MFENKFSFTLIIIIFFLKYVDSNKFYIVVFLYVSNSITSILDFSLGNKY